MHEDRSSVPENIPTTANGDPAATKAVRCQRWTIIRYGRLSTSRHGYEIAHD
jgi:hypothetical protein